MSEPSELTPDRAPSWLATDGPLIKIRLIVGGLLLAFVVGLFLGVADIVTFWWVDSVLMFLYFWGPLFILFILLWVVDLVAVVMGDPWEM